MFSVGSTYLKKDCRKLAKICPKTKNCIEMCDEILSKRKAFFLKIWQKVQKNQRICDKLFLSNFEVEILSKFATNKITDSNQTLSQLNLLVTK
jgi:transcriptional regulator